MVEKHDMEHIAKLAELEFEEEELKEITLRVDDILEHMAAVGSADTENVRPTSHVLDIKNVFREDEHRSSLSRKDALKNAPDVKDNGFKVPKID
ncbi:MAG: Asp-tRNA(Asn)/Glu-tRNA(Gln) amidotransferase subunit GatC [Actinomycetota bacterium]